MKKLPLILSIVALVGVIALAIVTFTKGGDKKPAAATTETAAQKGAIVYFNMDAIMQALQDAYWDAKKLNRKYTNKRYLTDDAGEDP